MKNEKIIEMIKVLGEMTDNDSYEYKMIWNELYEVCVNELHKLVNKKQYYFTSDYSQEDFEQDVMTNIFDKIWQYDATRGQFNTWIWRIGTNVYNSYRKLIDNKLKTVSMYVENEDINIIDCYKYSKSVEKEYFYNISSGELYKFISQLKDNYRKVVILCDIRGLKPSEAAKILGEKREDIYRWLNRAHNNLEKIITDNKIVENIYEEYEL